MTITIYAPAKVNLFLQIKGKRPDGFHELLTVFQTVGLFDTIHIGLGSTGINIIAPHYLPARQGNLAYSAATLFFEATGLLPSVSIELKKGIPVEAGLGGGSSDAAAVLKALNVLYNHPLSGTELEQLACQLGSDVAFFLYGGTAIGRGRGDQIEPLPDTPPLWYRLVKPPFGLSTPKVFSAWSGVSTADWATFSQSLSSLKAIRLYNDLEDAAFRIRPELSALKNDLLEDGASQALLSGSGSTVFGVYVEEPRHHMQLGEGYQQWTVKALTRAATGKGYGMGRELEDNG